MKKKIEDCIFKVWGKYVTSFEVIIYPGISLGRVGSLEIARSVRDSYVSQFGAAVRIRRPMGTGGIYYRNGKYEISYGKRKLGLKDTKEECEKFLKEYINSLPIRTYYTGRRMESFRVLPDART